MSIHDKENIVRYVEGELTPEEASVMEAAMKEDPSLAAEVALCRELRTTLAERLQPDPGADALRATLQGMNRKYFEGGASAGTTGTQGEAVRGPVSEPEGPRVRPARVIPFRKYLAGIAAAAALLFAVVRFWPSGSYLDRYGKTEMFSNTERGEGNDSLMTQAAAFFNAQEYVKALPLLDLAFKADSSNLSALFYRGVSRLHTGAVGDGRKDLERIYAGVSLFKYEAAFYMALSYAQQEDKRSALDWLGKIPEDAPVAGKAKELRGRLE